MKRPSLDRNLLRGAARLFGFSLGGLGSGTGCSDRITSNRPASPGTPRNYDALQRSHSLLSQLHDQQTLP